MPAERRTVVKRVLLGAAGLAALVFAVEGGEFGTLDLLRQKREKARLDVSIDSLRKVVDSLKKYENLVKNDPATQERIAREVFGMVRGNKEILYRFADSAAKRSP